MMSSLIPGSAHYGEGRTVWGRSGIEVEPADARLYLPCQAVWPNMEASMPALAKWLAQTLVDLSGLAGGQRGEGERRTPRQLRIGL